MMTQIGLWKGGEHCCCISESEKVEPVGGEGEERERGRKKEFYAEIVFDCGGVH